MENTAQILSEMQAFRQTIPTHAPLDLYLHMKNLMGTFAEENARLRATNERNSGLALETVHLKHELATKEREIAYLHTDAALAGDEHKSAQARRELEIESLQGERKNAQLWRETAELVGREREELGAKLAIAEGQLREARVESCVLSSKVVQLETKVLVAQAEVEDAVLARERVFGLGKKCDGLICEMGVVRKGNKVLRAEKKALAEENKGLKEEVAVLEEAAEMTGELMAEYMAEIEGLKAKLKKKNKA